MSRDAIGDAGGQPDNNCRTMKFKGNAESRKKWTKTA